MTDGSLDIRAIQARLQQFAKDRDWERFHDPRSLAVAVAIEAGELLERFQWLTAEESLAVRDHPESLSAVADEVADVAIYLLRLADVLDIEVGTAVWSKIDRNEERFPP